MGLDAQTLFDEVCKGQYSIQLLTLGLGLTRAGRVHEYQLNPAGPSERCQRSTG